MAQRSTKTIIVAALTCALALSACSANNNDASSNETARQAASADLWSNTDPCDEQTSWTFDMKVTNLTSIPLDLLAGEVDCYDWSGTSNPRRVLNGQPVPADSTNDYQLEPSLSSDRNWTMGLRAQGSEIGKFRISIPQGTSKLEITSQSQVAFDNNCVKTPVGPDPSGSASTVDPSITSAGVSVGRQTLWLWSDGSTIFAATCSLGGAPGVG